MKYIIAFMLIFAVLFSISACGNANNDAASSSNSEYIEQTGTSSKEKEESSQNASQKTSSSVSVSSENRVSSLVSKIDKDVSSNSEDIEQTGTSSKEKEESSQNASQKTSSSVSVSSEDKSSSLVSKIDKDVSSKNTENTSSPQEEQITDISSEEVVELTRKEQVLQGLDPDIYKLGLANKGNSARIASLMKRAQKGGSYTIGVLGGSITQGAITSSINDRYANHVLKWWEENFPKAEFTLVNAGIGATNPQMACYRIETDLLRYNPDFVVVDFAVNTYLDYDLENTYENLLYRILTHKNSPAVMGITFTHVTEKSYLAAWYTKAGEFPCEEIDAALKKYQIPTMSYHNYVWSFLEERDENNRKIFSWRDIAADYIHPNDTGHNIAARLITSHLDYVKDNLSTVSTKEPTVPKLKSEKYLDVQYITNKSKGVSFSGGFDALDNKYPITRGWRYSYTADASKLTATLSNNTEAFLFMQFESGSQGTVLVIGDNGEERRINVNEAATPTLVSIGQKGNKITIIPELTSGGFTIYGICADK